MIYFIGTPSNGRNHWTINLPSSSLQFGQSHSYRSSSSSRPQNLPRELNIKIPTLFISLPSHPCPSSSSCHSLFPRLLSDDPSDLVGGGWLFGWQCQWVLLLSHTINGAFVSVFLTISQSPLVAPIIHVIVMSYPREFTLNGLPNRLYTICRAETKNEHKQTWHRNQYICNLIN